MVHGVGARISCCHHTFIDGADERQKCGGGGIVEVRAALNARVQDEMEDKPLAMLVGNYLGWVNSYRKTHLD